MGGKPSRESQNRRARKYRRKKSASAAFRKRDAERQYRRRAKIDPNVLREYQRERRFRFLHEGPEEHSLKDAGLSIISERAIKHGVFVFEYRGRTSFERMDIDNVEAVIRECGN